MNLLAVIVVIIIAIFMIKGYRKGFAKGLASMVSLAASLVLVFFLAPHVSEFLKDNTPVYDHVLEKCEQTFSLKDASKNAENEKKTADGAKKTVMGGKDAEKLLENLALPELLNEIILNNNTSEKYLELAAENFYDYVPKFMAHLIMDIISFIVTWIVVLACMRIVIGVLGIVNHIPLIGGINRILGLVLGFVQGLLIIWIVFLVITTFSSSDIGKQLMNMIVENTLLREIYDHNLLMELLQNTAQNFF